MHMFLSYYLDILNQETHEQIYLVLFTRLLSLWILFVLRQAKIYRRYELFAICQQWRCVSQSGTVRSS